MSDKQLARVIEEALQQRAKLVADGKQTPCEIAKSFEQVVRQVWPFTRAWNYLCEDCSDTGLFVWTCKKGQRCNGISTRTDGPKEKPGKYRRLCAKDPDSDYEHTLGEPCSCVAGDRFRPRRVTEFDALDAAAARPKKQPTRFGR